MEPKLIYLQNKCDYQIMYMLFLIEIWQCDYQRLCWLNSDTDIDSNCGLMDKLFSLKLPCADINFET